MSNILITNLILHYLLFFESQSAQNLYHVNVSFPQNTTARKLALAESDELGEEESRSATIASAKEALLFQEAYKETTGTKSTKVHGHGYLSNPSKNQLLQERIEEQAREVEKL